MDFRPPAIFILEPLRTRGLEEEAMINPATCKLSRELDIPTVATNDVHYVRQEDAEAHDVLPCPDSHHHR